MQLRSREWGRSELRDWGRTEPPRMSANGAERVWQNRSSENEGAQSRESQGEWRRENEVERSCDWLDKLLGFVVWTDRNTNMLLCGSRFVSFPLLSKKGDVSGKMMLWIGVHVMFEKQTCDFPFKAYTKRTVLCKPLCATLWEHHFPKHLVPDPMPSAKLPTKM